MQLSPAAARWAAQLRVFAPEVAAALGALAARIAPALGPFPSATRAADGDPDGFDGLARRGSYERLLLSEWALAEEHGDEFLRRALAGEHGFLKLARARPRSARSCRVLIDAGPSQLGAPRIVQLAVLIALAERAAAAGADFRWQLLQRARDTWIESLNESSVGAFLDGRSALPADRAELAVRVAALEAERGAAPDEIWVVGGSELGRGLEARTSRVELGERIDGGDRSVRVRVLPRRRLAQALELEIPDDRVAVRLLRDPFGAAVPDRQLAPGKPASNLVFAANASKLFARDGRGAVLSYPVPNSPRARLGRTRRYPTEQGAMAFAVGSRRRTLLIAWSSEDKLRFWSPSPTPLLGDARYADLPFSAETEIFRVAAEPPLSMLIVPTTVSYAPKFWVVTPTRALLQIRPARHEVGKLEVERLAELTAAIAPLRNEAGTVHGIVFVARCVHSSEPGAFVRWRSVRLRHDGQRSEIELEGDGRFHTFLGTTPGATRDIAAIQQWENRWTLYGGERPLNLSPPDNLSGWACCDSTATWAWAWS